jgi:hypothetical protein
VTWSVPLNTPPQLLPSHSLTSYLICVLTTSAAICPLPPLFASHIPCPLLAQTQAHDCSYSLQARLCILMTYTGCFTMFSVITNIYNKKTKRTTLMELFTATGKLKKFFLTTRDVRCVHHGRDGTHRYDIQVLAPHASTWVH